jgi:hypothetical protein
MITVPDNSAGSLTAEHAQERGRTIVTPRALNRVVCAVTADIFHIASRAVDVDLSDQNGLLALTIRTPVRVTLLNQIRPSAIVPETSDGGLLQRVADAQTTIRERVTALTGSKVVHVTIRVTGIEAENESRVT